jgi:membrane protein YdbS with pleckstrin-like domain
MQFHSVELESLFALVLIFGVIPSFVLVGVLNRFKNRRYKIERQTELMAKMIERGDSSNLDFKAMAEALQDPKKQISTKASLLNNLKWGCIFSFVGLALLGVALYGHLTDAVVAEFLIIGGIICAIGLGFVVTFLISKNYLKHEIEKEEQQLTENK